MAGIRTPAPIATLERDMPEVYREFEAIADRLEQHYKDVQDLEFTIERGKLYMLQTRSAKRTGPAAVKIAVDLVGEGLIDKRTALGEKYVPARGYHAAAAATLRPRGQGAGDPRRAAAWHRAQCLSGRRSRQGRVHRRQGGGAGRCRRGGGAGAARDLARRRAWDDRRARRAHRPRWRHQPRRCGGPLDGQALRGRCWRTADRRSHRRDALPAIG